MSKKRAFSGIQPSGEVTLGNYLGAIKNWVKFQDDYDCIFSLVDLHTITVRQNPQKFHENIIKMYALFLACGIDPQKSIFFIQSHVKEHAELGWILQCYTQFGELSRMTQFKDKSQRHAENINAGLFAYPSLMAADILLYDANVVPVGEDQVQHVELTRDIAGRFNSLYGDIFTIPEAFVPKVGARVMSLQEPSKKMSKSDSNANSYILLLDTPDDILKKVKRSVTDSGSQVKFSGTKTGIDNLIGIYSALTQKEIIEIEHEFENQGYGNFKVAVAEAIIETFKPIQNKYKDYIKNIDYIQKTFEDAQVRASLIAESTVKKVKKAIGFC